jgi:hypothetical protein
MQQHMLQYNPHGKMGSILGNAHMTHAYKIKKHSLAISSVLSVRRVGRITSCRTYIVNTESNTSMRYKMCSLLDTTTTHRSTLGSYTLADHFTL